jgi:hypothetical protein
MHQVARILDRAIDLLYTWRQERHTHPEGKRDNGRRWWPSKAENLDGIQARIRTPSAAWPNSIIRACRSRCHCAALVRAARAGQKVPQDVRDALDAAGDNILSRAPLILMDASQADVDNTRALLAELQRWLSSPGPRGRTGRTAEELWLALELEPAVFVRALNIARARSLVRYQGGLVRLRPGAIEKLVEWEQNHRARTIMAPSISSTNPIERELAEALRDYTNPDHPEYDTEEIGRFQPKWLSN